MRQDPIRGAGFGLLNRYKRFLAGVVFGGVATLGCWSGGAVAGEINALRGSAEETDHTSSRPLDVAETLPLRPSHHSIGRSLTDVATGLPGLGGYIAENTVESTLFRGSHLAVEDRETDIVLPNRPSLRRSMMHAISYESGLRGDRASVGQSVASALRGSYSSKRAMENANAERARVHGAVANFLPSVNGSLEASRSSSSSFDGEKFRQDVFKASLEVTVPIFTSGVNLNTYRQARHVSLAADYSYLAEEYQVSLEAVTAHINLRLNRRIENTLKRNVRAMRRIQTVAQKLYEAGDASRTDVAIAAANVESAKAELDVARRTREETRADFESVTGNPVPARLTLSKPEALIPASLDAAIESALANNPTLMAARHTAIASEHNAKIVRGQFGPQISGFGTAERYMHDSLRNDRDDDWSVGVRLRVPLVDLTAVPSIKAAQHEAAESGYRALDEGRRIRRRVERQWSAYHSAKRRVGIAQRQETAIARGVEGINREYEAGFRSITDVLNEQVKLARAQITLESARHERVLAAYELAFTSAHDGVKNLASLN